MQRGPASASTGVEARVGVGTGREKLEAVNCSDIQGQSVQHTMVTSNVLEGQGKTDGNSSVCLGAGREVYSSECTESWGPALSQRGVRIVRRVV